MRIITRGDFDGLICAVLLSYREPIKKIHLTHAKDIQDRLVAVKTNDIIANLPYDPRCAMWFDHHRSEEEFARELIFKGKFDLAPSCARVIYDYYRQPEEWSHHLELLQMADKIDQADLNMQDVVNPQGWVLLSNTLQGFPGTKNLMSLQAYFLTLVNWIKNESIDKILQKREVKKRIALYLRKQNDYIDALKKHSYQEGNIVITDIRTLKEPVYGNRFLIYTLFPQQNISINIFKQRQKNKVVLACGQNIFNKNTGADIGGLLKRFGGGGHPGAGTCQVEPNEAEAVLSELISQMKQDG